MTTSGTPLLSFQGRLSARRYLRIQRRYALAGVLAITSVILGGFWLASIGFSWLGLGIFLAFLTGLAFVSLSLQVRRWHDHGLSGLWHLVNLAAIPCIVGVLLIFNHEPRLVPPMVLWALALGVALVTLVPSVWVQFVSGQKTENRFGPPPLD